MYTGVKFIKLELRPCCTDSTWNLIFLSSKWQVITTNFCRCHCSYAVVASAKNCSDPEARKFICDCSFALISIMSEKFLVEWGSPSSKLGFCFAGHSVQQFSKCWWINGNLAGSQCIVYYIHGVIYIGSLKKMPNIQTSLDGTFAGLAPFFMVLVLGP